MSNEINWGIAGLGNIAKRFAADLVQHCPGARLTAVASREEAKANDFASQFPGTAAYSYLQLAQDPKIQVVYIATIHPFHKPLISLFLQYGKHVLVEKPAVTNQQDWIDLQKQAQKQQCLLLEAMKTVTFPAYRQLRELIKDRNWQITELSASFGTANPVDQRLPILNRELSGGATLDVGVYPLWLYCDLCQLMNYTIPKPTVSIHNEHPQLQVDESVSFQFDGELKANLAASITKNLNKTAIISGPGFEITIAGKWWNPTQIAINYGQQQELIHIPATGGGFEYETMYITQLLQQGEYCSNWLDTNTSRQVIQIMETALQESGYEHLPHPTTD